MAPTATTPAQAPSELRKFTFRKNGKAHRGAERDGWRYCSCRCPGSQNGRLINGASIVAEGWEASNCGN